MPYPDNYVTTNLGNQLVYVEYAYNVVDLQSKFQACFHSLTSSAIYHITSVIFYYFY